MLPISSSTHAPKLIERPANIADNNRPRRPRGSHINAPCHDHNSDHTPTRSILHPARHDPALRPRFGGLAERECRSFKRDIQVYRRRSWDEEGE